LYTIFIRKLKASKMDTSLEFTNNPHVLLRFGKKDDPVLRNKSFSYDIEKIFTYYIDMKKAKTLKNRGTIKSKRYDFLDDLSISNECDDDSDEFMMRNEDDEFTMLDKTTSVLSYLVTLHTICRIPNSEYNKIYEKSETYIEFVKNFIDFIKSWIVGKTIENSVNSIITIIEDNMMYLEIMMVKNMNIYSVMEIYSYAQEREINNNVYLYLTIIGLSILAGFLFYFIIRRK